MGKGAGGCEREAIGLLAGIGTEDGAVDSEDGILGLQHSNVDFGDKASWGKNRFPNAFPIGLLTYMGQKSIRPRTIHVTPKGNLGKKYMAARTLLGGDALKDELYFRFESTFRKYEPLLAQGGSLPVNDVVVCHRSDDGPVEYLPLEVKLTVFPDKATADKDESEWGCELVVRQPTVVSLAFSIAAKSTQADLAAFKNLPVDWKNADRETIESSLMQMQTAVTNLLQHMKEDPLMLQTVWKTQGQTTQLADQCYDMFVWTDAAFAKLIVDRAGESPFFNDQYLSRPARSLVWLATMLDQYARTGKIHPQDAIDGNLLGAKTDKALSLSGNQTLQFMKSKEMTSPRIHKDAGNDIVLGNGAQHLKPERRLDGVIGSSLA